MMPLIFTKPLTLLLKFVLTSYFFGENQQKNYKKVEIINQSMVLTENFNGTMRKNLIFKNMNMQTIIILIWLALL